MACKSPAQTVKPKFHYANFPVTFVITPKLCRLGSFGEVGVMEFGLNGTSQVCRGLVADVTGKLA